MRAPVLWNSAHCSQVHRLTSNPSTNFPLWESLWYIYHTLKGLKRYQICLTHSVPSSERKVLYSNCYSLTETSDLTCLPLWFISLLSVWEMLIRSLIFMSVSIFKCEVKPAAVGERLIFNLIIWEMSAVKVLSECLLTDSCNTSQKDQCIHSGQLYSCCSRVYGKIRTFQYHHFCFVHFQTHGGAAGLSKTGFPANSQQQQQQQLRAPRGKMRAF